MTKPNKLILLTLMLSMASFAQAEEAAFAEDPVQEELEIPKMLPDHPLYFFKSIWRRAQETLTFNQEKRLELQQRLATEKLAELEGLTKKQARQEIIEKTRLKYQERAELMKTRVEKLKEKAEENPRMNSFLKQYKNQEQVHSRILKKLDNKLPEEVKERIEAKKQNHLEKYKTIKANLEEKDLSSEQAEKKAKDQIRRATDKPTLKRVKTKAQTNFKALRMKLKPDSLTPSLDSAE